MNRRSFLKGLALAAPALFLPKLIMPAWKPTIKPQHLIGFAGDPQALMIACRVEDIIWIEGIHGLTVAKVVHRYPQFSPCFGIGKGINGIKSTS